MDLAHTLLVHPRLYAAFHRLVSGRKLLNLERALVVERRRKPALKVLDLGCGPGTAATLFSSLGCDYLGIELDQGYVEHARRRFPGRFSQGDITSLDDLGERFDVVVLNSVLHHLDDRGAQAALSSGARHLLPDGALLLMDMVTPRGASPVAALQRLLLSLDRGPFCRSREGLAALASARFQQVERTSFLLPHELAPLWEMELHVCRRPIVT